MQPKRIIASLLAVILICLAAGLSVSAAETPAPLNMAVSVSSEAAIATVPATVVQAGDAVKVSVTVAENPGVAYLEFDLVYDPAILSVKMNGDKISYQAGTVFAAEKLIVFSKEDGVIGVRYPGSDLSVVSNANIVTVDFTVNDCAEATKGQTNVTMEMVTAAKDDFSLVNYTFANDGVAAFAAHKELTKVETSQFECVGDIFQCGACEAKVSADGPKPHTIVTVKEVAPSCGVVGSTAYEACSVCGLKATEPEEIPALPMHEILIATAVKDATCTENGNTAYWTCYHCGKLFADDKAAVETTAEAVVVEATQHNWVTDAAVEPTYGSTGLTEGSHCGKCGEIQTKQEVIPQKSLVWLWILIAVVVVVAAGVVAYFFIYKKQVKRY